MFLRNLLFSARNTFKNQIQNCSISLEIPSQNELEIGVEEIEKKISMAMQAYLERKRVYNEFIKNEETKYQIGKRHLANMMGFDPETFTQEQVNESIEYLFPSGLFEKKARPFMKPPELVFPPQKDAQFDETGRPFHYLFYTARPNFFSTLHELVTHFNKLKSLEDNMIKNGTFQQDMFDGSGSRWLSKDELETNLVEEIMDEDYLNYTRSLERLLEHPLSSKVQEFILQHRKSLAETTMNFFDIPKPSVDENGIFYVTTKECPRKSARADVTVKKPGNGKILINGKDIEYFQSVQSRQQILFPLELTGLRLSVDVEATVKGGGETGQSGAIRWGISWGLRSFVSQEMVDTMRLAGLLTRDFRRRERKKPGQKGARAKFTWKKR